MKASTIHLCMAMLPALGLALTAQAAEPPPPQTWTLSTADTELTLSVANNALNLVSLRHPAQKWNWVPSPSPVPLPGVQVGADYQAVPWQFREATEDRTQGHQVTFRFTCAAPALELTSVWRARPGPGPVENEVSVKNTSTGAVTFGPGLAAASVDLTADAAVTLHRADKTNVGQGRVYEDALGPNATFTTNSGVIPLIMLGVGSMHGAYLGFEWELGGFTVATPANPLRMTASVHPLTENVTRAPGEVFVVPSVYYGVYQGDFDDGGNRFKRWFWNYKITRSLHDNPGEPWIEVCMQEIGGNGSSSVTGDIAQAAYDRLAATGAECVKLDFWDGSGKCWYTDRDWQFHPESWPHGFDFAAKAHQAGLKASLYMGGTYRDADLTTTAGRDAELEAVRTRYDQGWFDMWRTDLYTAPHEPMPQTYQGVTNFLYIQDQLIRSRPGYRYENCCNGGKYKGFAICRRMTFCTMNDVDSKADVTRTTYYANTYAINPVQLKSDLGPASEAYDLRTDMLGSILTWAADNPVYRRHLALYKARQRPILRGANVYHILPMADGTNWDGLQFFNPDLNQGSVFLFKPSVKAADGDSKLIKLKGLDRKATYALAFQDRASLNCLRTGAELMDAGITVSGLTGSRASEIIWISGASALAVIQVDSAAREVMLPIRFDGAQSGSTSGKLVSYAWDFGDGATARGAAATHTYAQVGTYPASLTVRDDQGRSDTSHVTVTVLPLDTVAPTVLAAAVPSSQPDRVVVTCSEPVMPTDAETAANYALDQGVQVLAASLGTDLRTVTLTTSPRAAGAEYTLTVKNLRDRAHRPNTMTENRTVFLNAPLFAWWKLNEGQGLVASDVAGHDLPGALRGEPAWTTAAGRAALSFDGVDDVVDCPTHLEDLILPFSVAFWVNPAPTQVEYADILGSHAGALGLVMQQAGQQANLFALGYGDGQHSSGPGPVQLLADQWQHVVVVCDGHNSLCYVNGEEKSRAQTQGGFAPNPSLTFRLGQGYGSGRFFHGLLSDVRLYTTALSPAEVQTVMREGAPGPAPASAGG
ncbi:MAG TPA: LamG-like jellyroll fold domain-containing protein [Armatimonadota bacterium]|jgi:hypothetical protein